LHKPPFGILDSPERIRGALWTAGDRGPEANITSTPGSISAGCRRLARQLHRTVGRPQQPLHSTCAVVGSAGGLHGSGQGSEIDAHDAVFRFNMAPTGGNHGHDVGNRTTFWIASHAPWRTQMRTRIGSTAAAGEQAALYCFNPWLGSCFSDVLGGKRADARGAIVAPLLISPVLAARMMALQVALGGKTNGNVRPSTGLMGIGVALASCAKISIYGFANFSDLATQSFCNHYYDCRFNQTRYLSGKMGYHDWAGQWRVLSALVRLGAVQYHAPSGAQGGSQWTPARVAALVAAAKDLKGKHARPNSRRPALNSSVERGASRGRAARLVSRRAATNKTVATVGADGMGFKSRGARAKSRLSSLNVTTSGEIGSLRGRSARSGVRQAKLQQKNSTSARHTPRGLRPNGRPNGTHAAPRRGKVGWTE
jgi:hypothetical protein